MSLVAERHKDVRTIVKVVSEKRNKGEKGIYSKMRLVKWRTFVKKKEKKENLTDCERIFFHSNFVYTLHRVTTRAYKILRSDDCIESFSIDIP